MIRWSYLVPRLIILGLVLLVVWISADPLLRYAVVNATESVTGSKVEVGRVKSSLFKGKVFLEELAISDPRNPMQNLIQADVAYLQLNPQRLLHRQLVVEHAHSTNVMFGAPRTVSGELPDREYRFEDLKSWLPSAPKSEIFDSEHWMDQLQSRITGYSKDNLELVKVSKQLQEEWPAVFAQKLAQIAKMQSRVAELKQTIETPGQNPLRDRDQITNAISQVDAIGQQLKSANEEMNRLVQKAQKDLERVEQAKMQDTAKIQQFSAYSVDAETFSNLLLAKDQTTRLQEVINWVRWFRNSIPDPENDFHPARHRGTDIAFQGQQTHPQFLIKTLELEGQGTVSDQHFDFAGIAKNLTTQPSLHDQPATFELRAQGEHHLIVNCTLDRRNSTWKDQLEITCPDLDIPGQNLGDGDTLIVQMRPSRMQAEVNIQINGDELSGALRFRHSNCSLYVDKIDEYAGGQDMQLRMNQELARIQEFSTYATLTGTLDNPSLKFESDLGQQFAASMGRIIKDKADQQIADVQREINQRYQDEIYELNKMLKVNFDEIKQQLYGGSTLVSELIENIPDQGAWPSIRR